MNNEYALSPFSSVANFADAQRMAVGLAASTMVPEQFRSGSNGNAGVSNCLIALELASRLKASPFMVMQEVYIIHGRPAFSAKFIIASLNSCGKFSALRFVFRNDANGKVYGCKAVATELATGEVLEGPEITMDMARAEGWLNKSGSKWQTMPEVMMRYRAAAFFGRLYAPETMMGIMSAEEVEDMDGKDLRYNANGEVKLSAIDELNSLVAKKADVQTVDAEVVSEAPAEEAKAEEVKTEEAPAEEAPEPKAKARSYRKAAEATAELPLSDENGNLL